MGSPKTRKGLLLSSSFDAQRDPSLDRDGLIGYSARCDDGSGIIAAVLAGDNMGDSIFVGLRSCELDSCSRS